MLYGLLHTGFMQSYMLKHITAYLSKELQVEITAGAIDFSPFRSIILEEVSMNDRESRQMLTVEQMAFHLEKFSRRNQLISFSKIEFNDALINIYKDEDQYNFWFLIDYFSKEDTAIINDSQSPWDFKLKSVKLSNSALNYRQNDSHIDYQGFNPESFSLHDINLAMNGIVLSNSEAFFELDYLRLKEASGQSLNHLSGTFYLNQTSAIAENFLLRTNKSEIKLDLKAFINTPNTTAFSLDDLSFELDVAPSVIHLSEIAHYYHPIYGVNSDLFISGNITGTGRTVSGQKIQLTGGNNTSFRGNFLITDIIDFQRSKFDIRVEELSSSFADIKNFSLPNAWQIDRQLLPEILYELGNATYNGTLAGTLDNFNFEGTLYTDIGNLQNNFTLKKDEPGNHYHYNGRIDARSFDLGKLLNNKELLGKADIQAGFSGYGFTRDNINLHLDGNIANINILNHNYHNIELSGLITDRKFNGNFSVDDESLYLDFLGIVDFGEEIPVFDFRASIEDANLGVLNAYQRDTLTTTLFSTDVSIKARGRSMDDMEGVITFTDLLYKEITHADDLLPGDTLILFTDSIYISNTLWPENQKHFRVRSDFIDVDIHGKIKFEEIRNSFDFFLHYYIPALNHVSEELPKPEYDAQDVEFSVRIKELDALSRLFFPGITVSPGSWINGSYRSKHHFFELEAYAGKFEFAGRTFIDWQISGENIDDQLIFSTYSQKMMLSDSLHLDFFELQALIAADTLCLEILWNGIDNERKNSGHLIGTGKILSPNAFEFVFLPSHAYIEGDLWQLNVDHKIFIEKNRIEVHQLMTYNHEQFIRADGVLSQDANDRMNLSFGNFDVSYSEHLMNTKNFEFGGTMNGYISFTGLYQQPSVITELFVSNFSFNHDHLGDLFVESLWDNDKQVFVVDASITYHGNIGSNQPLLVTGHIDPNSDGQNFNLDINITNKKMSVWGRYMQGFAENFRGLASGRLRLDGAFNNPELTGNVRLLRTALHIPYLNTTYSFAHDVEIGKDYFLFDEVVLNDTIGNTAILSGRLMHNRFKDFSIDFRLSPERMVIFNTTAAQQDYYYGTAFLTGMAHIHGPVNNITMDVSARTNRGTNVILPLDYTGEIRESQFISFVRRDEGEDAPAFMPPEIRGGMALNFDLEVTPDAELQLLFDAQFGDIIRGRGTGNLKLEITPEGLFNIYGDYVIESGEYIFMLQNIINKRFRIEQGSTIRWTGDLNDADVELSAVYQVRTQLYDLIAGEFNDPATAEIYRRRLPIETVLMLDDKLFNPAISFDIRVPGGDENTRELIERVITTEQEMNRQVFSLLVLNRFVPTTFDQYNTALGYGVGSTSSELLSNQLSNWLSQISSDFDIGINYRPGDELSSQELELALSTQLFDDRVLIDGNFGVAGNETAGGQSTQGASQIIGDVNIEVKLTPEGKLRVKAFNRSNTFDILNTNAPYTQGIGIFYRREFDDLFHVFRRQRQDGELPGQASIETGSDPAETSSRQGSDFQNETP